MDTDLFQLVLLALLAVGLIVLIALLATLGGIRRALERRPAADDSTASAAPPTEQAAVESAVEEPAPAAAAVGSEPSTAQPATTASGSPGQADTIRSVLHQHGLSEGATAAPAAATSAAAEPVVDSAFASHADDPQEEPFQRDGRWWFRRGDELLLYNEGTGQWEPAPDQAPGAAATAAPAAAAQGQSAPTGTTTATADMPAVADQVATFWKCPTCGAVNGSTAASCRMCFASRP